LPNTCDISNICSNPILPDCTMGYNCDENLCNCRLPNTCDKSSICVNTSLPDCNLKDSCNQIDSTCECRTPNACLAGHCFKQCDLNCAGEGVDCVCSDPKDCDFNEALGYYACLPNCEINASCDKNCNCSGIFNSCVNGICQGPCNIGESCDKCRCLGPNTCVSGICQALTNPCDDGDNCSMCVCTGNMRCNSNNICGPIPP
jgi:hypothetical protein